jgi:hypothetical protein
MTRRHIFDFLNAKYSKYYTLFKGRIILKIKYPRYTRFRIKLYKSCNMSSYTYDMGFYLGKNRTRTITDATATHATQTMERKCRGTWM